MNENLNRVYRWTLDFFIEFLSCTGIVTILMMTGLIFLVDNVKKILSELKFFIEK